MKIILLSLLFLSVIACGQTPQNTVVENKKRIENWKELDRPSFFIQYPSTWELNETGMLGSSFFLFAPKESSKDKFQKNIDLVIQSLNGLDIDLRKYSEFSENQIKSTVVNYRLIEKRVMKSDKNEYIKIIYTCDRGAFRMEFEQYDYVMNGKIYVLTFAVEQDKFNDYKDTAEKILISLVIKN